MAKIIEALRTAKGTLSEFAESDKCPLSGNGLLNCSEEPVLVEAVLAESDDAATEIRRATSDEDIGDTASVIRLENAEERRPHSESLPAAPYEEPDENIFFIEVGGPNRQIEGSPEVMAFSPKSRQATAETADDAPATLAISIQEPSQPSIKFQPWPRDQKSANSRVPGPALVVYHIPDCAASRLYAQLSEQVLDSAGRKKILLFTATDESQGSPATLLNMAFSVAQRTDFKVAIVDADWNSPNISEHLGLSAEPGLREVLAGDVALGDALQDSPLGNLSFLAYGEPATGGAELWTVEALRWITHCLSARFDLVLFNAPAIDQSQEFAALVSVSEAVYPIVPERTADKEQLHHTISKITRAGAEVCGLIYDCFPTD